MARKRSRRLGRVPIAIAACAALAALGYVLVSVYGLGPSSLVSSRPAAATSSGSAGANLQLTLNPNLFAGKAHRAYEVAAHDPALLAQLHCYCGCERDGSMRNLLDCYRTDHGSHCPICMDEALEAERLVKQGVPVERIRDMIRARFAAGE